LKSENETETTNYTINCRNKSIAAVEILKKADGKIVNIKYTGKIESGKLTLPSKVIVSNNFGGEQIEILIKKLQSEELEEISFSEGRNYEKVEIK
jgi:hypothetical protein